jgi:predicted nucleic acid-binding protein
MTLVVADASVLINFIHIDRLELFSALQRFAFVVTDQAVEEITRPAQAQALAAALERGYLRREASVDPVEINSYAQLAQILGKQPNQARNAW